MKDKLTTMNDYVNFLIQKIGEGGDFLKDQIPPLINEIILFERFIAILYFLISLGILLTSIYFINLIYKKTLSKKYGYEDYDVGITVLLCFAGFASFVNSILSIYEVLKIFLAPKLYILEYLREFIK